jgi:hypothetical protein
MRRGEIKEIENEDLIRELLRLGYVEDLGGESSTKGAEPKKRGRKPKEAAQNG